MTTPTAEQISAAYDNATVSDVIVCEFTDMVYATVNGYKNEYVGQVGDYS